MADVACWAGSCVVNRCFPGYEVSADGTFCLASHGILEQNQERGHGAGHGLYHRSMNSSTEGEGNEELAMKCSISRIFATVSWKDDVQVPFMYCLGNGNVE